MEQQENSPAMKYLWIVIAIFCTISIAWWFFSHAGNIAQDPLWLLVPRRNNFFLLILAFVMIVAIPWLYHAWKNRAGPQPDSVPVFSDAAEGSLQGPEPEIPLQTDTFEGRLPYYVMALILVLFAAGSFVRSSHSLEILTMFAGALLFCYGLAFLAIRDWGTRWGINMLATILLFFIFGLMETGGYF